jgi:hypothetical protein
MARYFFNCTGGRTYYDWNERYDTSDWPIYDHYACGNYDGDGNGNYRSIVLFNSADIRSRLSGLRVTGCFLDIYVTDSEYDTFNLYIGTHNYTSAPDIWSSSRVNRNRLNRNEQPRGQISSWNIGTTIGTEFKDGVTTGIALGPPPSDDYNYFYTIAPNGHSREPVLIIDAEAVNVAPNAPTLNAPAPDAVLDTFNSGVTFQWTHVDPNGDPMSAWRFRRRLPNGSYDYWNGTAFVPTQTDMTTAVPAAGIFIPAGIWANDARMEWSVATRDPAGLWSAYSVPRVLFSSVRPTTVVQAVPANTPRPTITWTYADADGDPQYGWAAQIVEPAVYNDPAWNPDTFLRQYWSTSAAGTATAAAVGRDLINHRTYRAYVKTSSSPNPASGLQWSAWSYREFQVIIPPNASGITFPANGSVVDLAAGFTLSWNNNHYGGAGAQTAVAIRRQVGGTGAYTYWNGTAWVALPANGIPPYIPGNSPAYSFPPNAFVNNQVYSISVQIRDDYNQTSPWSSAVTVTASTAAQVTVVAPQTVSVVSNPLVTWTMFDIENDPQQTYQVRVIHSSVFESGTNIDPGTATAVWATSEVVDTGGQTRNVQIEANLENANRYRAYVRVRTNGVYSGWSFAEFTINIVPPATPAVVAVVGEGYIEVTVQGRDNMLSDEASRNFGAHWIPAAPSNSPPTVVNSVQFGSSGSGYASRVTSTIAGTMTAVTNFAWPVAAGQTYTGAASVLAGLNMTAVGAYCSIEWLDANTNLIGVSSPTPQTDDSAVRSSVTDVAPAGAVYGRLRITFQNVPASGQQHIFFNPVLRPGTGDEWSGGGTLSKTFVTVYERGENRELRYGRNVPLPIDSQRIVIRDYEARMGVEAVYEASVRAVYPNAALVSTLGPSQPVRWVSGWLWLSDPLRPGSGRRFAPVSFDAITRPVRQGKFRPIGRADAVITTGVRGLREGSFTIVCHTREEREAFQELSDFSETVLVRIPPDTADPRIADLEGETIYVRFEGDAPEERPLPSRTPHRVIKQAWTEQRSPEVGFDYEDVE